MSVQSDCRISSSISLASAAEPLPSLGTGSPSLHPFSLPGDLSAGSSSATLAGEIPQDRHEERNSAIRTQGDESDKHATTISMLPDDVLLSIFDFYRKDQDDNGPRYMFSQWGPLKWHLLVHVCHRWRQIVFASPRQLNLHIPCTTRTPVKENLGIWPAFPIVVVYDYKYDFMPIGEDNILAALRHADRVCEVRFALLDSQLVEMAAVVQDPFPMLTCLCIFSSPGNAPDLPAGFLGGFAPNLKDISLHRISYPAFPTLLLSTTHLFKLDLFDIPSNGYISPETIAASLAALPRLEMFILGFRDATSRPDRIPPPPATRVVLPALAFFVFRGAHEYLEDLVSRIESPHLNHISIFYMYWPLFQVTQLSKFLDRSVGSKLTKCRHAEVRFSRGLVVFEFCRRTNYPDQDRHHLPTTNIFYEGIDWQNTPISQLLSQFPATLDHVIHLRLKGNHEEFQSEGPEVEWPHLLHQFSAVQTLFVHRGLSRHVALALEDITDEMATEVLPSLQLICLESGQPEVPPLDKFVAARRHSDYPVTVVNTIREFRERLESSQ